MLKKRFLWLMLLMGMLALSGACAATNSAATDPTDHSKRPADADKWYYSELVDLAFVEDHVGVKRTPDVMIIDSRPYKTKYVKGYIPTSYSIPFSEMEKRIGELPEKKDTLLIFYCEGPG